MFTSSSREFLLNACRLSQGSSAGALSSAAKELPSLILRNLPHRMVQTPSLHSLISWAHNGLSFSVFNPTEFSKSVLPMFFKHNNFQSFVRQVSTLYPSYPCTQAHSRLAIAAQHVWFPQVGASFPIARRRRGSLLTASSRRRVNDMLGTVLAGQDGVIAWEFQHASFQRDRPELLARIKRKSSKGGASAAANPPSPSGATSGRKSGQTSSSSSSSRLRSLSKERPAPLLPKEEAPSAPIEPAAPPLRAGGVVVPEGGYFERPLPTAGRASGTFHRAKVERGEQAPIIARCSQLIVHRLQTPSHYSAVHHPRYLLLSAPIPIPIRTSRLATLPTRCLLPPTLLRSLQDLKPQRKACPASWPGSRRKCEVLATHCISASRRITPRG